jgi:hypothetical protein
MSNILEFRIVADVPFNYLSERRDGEGLSVEDAAGLASLVLTPGTDCTLNSFELGTIPNRRGGRTTMYRVSIEGREGISTLLLRRIALALKGCKFGKLHIAEALDVEDLGGHWEHVVDKKELSGEAI